MIAVYVTTTEAMIRNRSEEEILSLLCEGHRRELAGRIGKRGFLDSCAAELLLREAVREWIPGSDPSLWTWKTGEHGKPEIPELAPLTFNLSHSGGYVVAAVSDRNVGIDLQEMTKVRSSVLKHFFTEEQRARVEGAPDPDLAFTTLWTETEAAVKWSGRGLTREQGERPPFLRSFIREGEYVLSVASDEAWDGEIGFR